MSGLTFLVVAMMLIVKQKNKEYFTQAFLGGTTIKILACLVFIVLFLMKNKLNKHVFLADFFYVYLLNMVFEVYVLLRNLRHKNLR
jgi:F0F1-type ATP synthase assembly protein I